MASSLRDCFFFFSDLSLSLFKSLLEPSHKTTPQTKT